MKLVLDASPSAEILGRYDPALFSNFRPIFEASDQETPMRHLVCDPEEANAALVIENLSKKDLTALRYCWHVRGEDGTEKGIRFRQIVMGWMFSTRCSHEASANYSWSTTVDESLLEHHSAVVASCVAEDFRDRFVT